MTRAMTQNQQISLEEGVNNLLRQVAQQRPMIEPVLPSNVGFERWQSVLAMALRKDPELLECYLPSLITAALQSAYDELMPDKREGAFVVYNNKDGNNQWRKEAQWMPMVYGIRKKIMRSGLVSDVKSKVVFANEPFEYEEGLNPILVHRPVLDTERRGDFIAVYSIAILRDGVKTFEVLTAADVEQIKQQAKTKMVWDKWPDEMRRKSAVRRHAKSLPGGRDLLDVEAQVMFPQFATGPALPPMVDPENAPAIPRRSHYLEAPRQYVDPFAGGWSGDQREAVREEPQAQQEQRRRPRQRQDGGRQDEQQSGDQQQKRDVAPTRQEPSEEWEQWKARFLESAKLKNTTDALKKFEASEKRNIDTAPDQIAMTVRDFLDERYEMFRTDNV